LWDVKGGKPRGEPFRGHRSAVNGVAFSADGSTLASASGDLTVILWDPNPESWESLATRKANRNLSLAEWKQYMGSDRPYHVTSTEFPLGDGLSEADLAADRLNSGPAAAQVSGSK
jgi:WD40 repeat protein